MGYRLGEKIRRPKLVILGVSCSLSGPYYFCAPAAYIGHLGDYTCSLTSNFTSTAHRCAPNPRQISGEEGRPERALREGPRRVFLPRQVLGGSQHQRLGRGPHVLRRHDNVSILRLTLWLSQHNTGIRDENSCNPSYRFGCTTLVQNNKSLNIGGVGFVNSLILPVS